MTEKQILAVHNIIMETLKVTPTAWDMNGESYNCGCYIELTEDTYISVGRLFSGDAKLGEEVVNRYLTLTNGQI
jgi:hypothetical protein